MFAQKLVDQLGESLRSVMDGVIGIVPEILGALVVFIVGLIFASALDRVVRQIVKVLKIHAAFEKAGISSFFASAGVSFDIGVVLGWLARVFVVIVFLVAAIDILGLTTVNEFLRSIVLNYLPQVFVAVLVLLFATIVSDLVAKIVTGGTQALGLKASRFLGAVVKVSIWIFAIIVALSHLGIGAQYLYTLFTGVVVMLALAGGLAFGLGGKEAASDLIQSIRDELRKDMKHPHE